MSVLDTRIFGKIAFSFFCAARTFSQFPIETLNRDAIKYYVSKGVVSKKGIGFIKNDKSSLFRSALLQLLVAKNRDARKKMFGFRKPVPGKIN